MRLSIFDLSERQSILAGSAAGRKLLAALIAATPAVDAPEALFLDFGGVKVATSSFLREIRAASELLEVNLSLPF